MTYAPATYLEVRRVFQRETPLSAIELGITHSTPQGGGYHEGNDLLALAGRLDSDYSKRESPRDRPGTDGAAAIDIGWFDVTLPGGRRVTLRTLNMWMEHNWNAPDAAWLREWIYSLDGVVVKRLDRLNIRFGGDQSHTSHSHGSGFRDDEDVPKAPLFERFWAEQKGTDMTNFGPLPPPPNIPEFARQAPDIWLADLYAFLVQGKTGWGPEADAQTWKFAQWMNAVTTGITALMNRSPVALSPEMLDTWAGDIVDRLVAHGDVPISQENAALVLRLAKQALREGAGPQ